MENYKRPDRVFMKRPEKFNKALLLKHEEYLQLGREGKCWRGLEITAEGMEYEEQFVSFLKRYLKCPIYYKVKYLIGMPGRFIVGKLGYQAIMNHNPFALYVLRTLNYNI